MNELKLQQFIVDAVNGAGGFGHKMSNRFLIGVSDLLVKLSPKTNHDALRGCPAGFLEVKQRDYTRGLDVFTLDVTFPQAKFLQDAAKADMPCGVASFLQKGTGSGLTLWLNIRVWETGWKPGDAIRADARTHIELSRKPEARANDILTHLYEWQRAWREGR